MQLTSNVQTPITFLFVNTIIKCGQSFSKLEHEEHCSDFAFSAPPASVSSNEAMHEAYVT